MPGKRKPGGMENLEKLLPVYNSFIDSINRSKEGTAIVSLYSLHVCALIQRQLKLTLDNIVYTPRRLSRRNFLE